MGGRVLPQLFLPGGINSSNQFVRQLLLPLHLNQRRAADAALTIELKPDRDTGGWMYTAATVLTLDMAFNNARLVTTIETPWLREAVQAAESDPQAFNATVTAPETGPPSLGERSAWPEPALP